MPSVQQTVPTWNDDFEPNDVATTVVESTLAEVMQHSTIDSYLHHSSVLVSYC
jgi:hypothetical protein